MTYRNYLIGALLCFLLVATIFFAERSRTHDTAGSNGKIILTYRTGTGSTATTTSQTFPSSTTWTAPTGVTSVTVELWGAEADGSGFKGEAGAYVHSVVPVTPGHNYTITIGAGGVRGGGGSSSFTYDGATIFASGGRGASATSTISTHFMF
jgi:hypothetical protein